MRKLAINGIGCTFTALILVLTVTLKFDQGGWVTVAMTGGMVAICMIVQAHYEYVRKAIQRVFGQHFRTVVFVGVGEVDSALLKGPEEVRTLEQQVADDMVEYCRFA